MSFEFDKRTPLEICGKEYDIDIADVGFVTGLVTSYVNIIKKADEFQALQNALTGRMGKEASAEELQKLSEEVATANKELYEYAKGFIVDTLGEENYREIFSLRRPNSAEHIKLCAYIYQEALSKRGEELEKLVYKPRNRSERRAADIPT